MTLILEMHQFDYQMWYWLRYWLISQIGKQINDTDPLLFFSSFFCKPLNFIYLKMPSLSGASLSPSKSSSDPGDDGSSTLFSQDMTAKSIIDSSIYLKLFILDNLWKNKLTPPWEGHNKTPPPGALWTLGTPWIN